MKKVIILAGLPAVGKSTYAKTIKSDDKVEIISSDETRYKFTRAYDVFLEDMTLIYDTMITNANRLLKANDNITIVLDANFLTDRRRNYFLDRLVGYDKIELIMLKVKNMNLIYSRNAQREVSRWVPDEILSSMIMKYEDVSKQYQNRYNDIKIIYMDENM